VRRSDYLSVAELSRVTCIGLRTLWRYLDTDATPALRRWKRRMPGSKRWLWHRNVIPWLERTYLEGLEKKNAGPEGPNT